MFGSRERDESGDVVGGDLDISNLGLVSGAGVTGGNQDFSDTRRGGALPGQRMLASP
jgi:hypothetical protein